ncbi:MAG: SUMF1/EgtB/PvdO family nonheme iron enzyme, partial [Anaerolineales bacterium]|nr:SUMF1/EgtB/PvdO family nonheme iron enzyme [Anaerolineales bacterium]
MNVDTALLRQFLSEKFSATELDTFLFDYFPLVHSDITPTMPNSHKIQMLLEHCRNRERFPDLFAALEREKPGAFRTEDFAPMPQAVPHPRPAPAAPIKRNPRQIFISHAHQDAEFAARLAADLQAHGWEIWMAPDSIQPGEKWVEAINRGLAESGVFLLVLTENAINSRWVVSETNVAIGMEHREELRLFMLAKESVNAPPLWQAYQHIAMRSNYDRGFNQLLRALDPGRNRPQRPSEVKSRDFAEAKVIKSPRPKPDETAKNSFVDAKTGKEMIRIPAGEFLYGENKEKSYLDEFWIAKTPVTNAEYARFVAGTKHEPPQHWGGSQPPADIANHPVVYVSWHDAKAFAKWAGAKLPTEQQWEKAARGVDGRNYPWGNEWRKNHCNTSETGINATTPVGQFSPQGDSPYGCVDMSGNVWEWTESKREEGSDRRVLRGGSWNNDPADVRCANRGSNAPDDRLGNIGFRLARAV